MGMGELKNMCKRFGLKSSGSKIDLITKLAEHILSAKKVEHEQCVDEKHVLGNHNRVPWSELTPASATKNSQCTHKSPLCGAGSVKGESSKENVIMHLLTKESTKPPHEDGYQDDEKATYPTKMTVDIVEEEDREGCGDDEKATNPTKTTTDIVEKEDCEAGKHQNDSTSDSAGEEYMSDETDFKEHVGVTTVLDASGTSFAVGEESEGLSSEDVEENTVPNYFAKMPADVVTGEKCGASSRKRVHCEVTGYDLD